MPNQNKFKTSNKNYDCMYFVNINTNKNKIKICGLFVV